MNNTMTYKDYIGSVEFNETDNLFYGKVLGIKSLISYEGENAKDLVSDFHSAVDFYLEDCKNRNVEPEKAFKGSFNVRIDSNLHKEIATFAFQNNTTINSIVEKALASYVKKLI